MPDLFATGAAAVTAVLDAASVLLRWLYCGAYSSSPADTGCFEHLIGDLGGESVRKGNYILLQSSAGVWRNRRSKTP